MKRTHREAKALPRTWGSLSRDIIAEADLRVTRRGRLRAKLLIFRNQTALQRFWNGKLRSAAGRLKGGTLGRFTIGAVNGLVRWNEHCKPDGTWTRRVAITDPRYFCVIGLCKPHLTMLVISHEAVHAGYAYAKRVKRTPWAAARAFDEELVAYPAGEIARWIVVWLNRWGLNK